MISESLKNKQRQAYLSLWTKFIMTGNDVNHEVEDDFSDALFTKTEVVKCMVSPAGKGTVQLPDDAFGAYQAIISGLDEAAVNEILDDYLLEDGVAACSDNLRRCYYQIGRNTQFWVEYENREPRRILVRKSPLEAKCIWHRYADNLISLPLVIAEET